MPDNIKVSIKLTKRLDTGFIPYMRYLKTLNGKQAPFGTRSMDQVEVDVYLSAELGAGETPVQLSEDMIHSANTMLTGWFKANYPTAFPASEIKSEPKVNEEAFVVTSTEVSIEQGAEY
jgi:hypothetical protein